MSDAEKELPEQPPIDGEHTGERLPDDPLASGSDAERESAAVEVVATPPPVAPEEAAASQAVVGDPPSTQIGVAADIKPADNANQAGQNDPPEPPDTALADAAVLAASRRHTRRSFLVAGAGAAAAYGFYRYLDTADRMEMQPPPIANIYKANAALSRGVFRNAELAPTYPLSRAENLRINGIYGLKMDLVPESWRLQLVGTRGAEQHPSFVNDVTAWEYQYKAPSANEDKGHDTKVDPNIATAAKMAPEEVMAKAQEDENHTGRKPRGKEEAGESDSTLAPGTPGLLLTMTDITKLPRRELVTQFKCIEGWSQIVHWAGVRMADFLEVYPPDPIDGGEPRYVYMETPDGDYSQATISTFCIIRRRCW